MTQQTRPSERATRWYAALLRLYPADHRRAFGDQMVRTFRDQYADTQAHGERVGVAFWLAVIGDEATCSLKEHAVALRGRRILPNLLLIGALLLMASSFVWMHGFILAIKIPVAVLLMICLIVKRSRRTNAAARHASEHVWMRHGVRNGCALGLLWVALNLARYRSAYDSPLRDAAKSLDLGILLLGLPLLIGLAGFISARRSGAITDGTLAGFLAAVVGAAIMTLSLIAILLLSWESARADAFQTAEMIRAWRASGDQSFDRYLWGDILGGALTMAIVSLVFGGLFGSLGGALGAVLPRSGGGAGTGMSAAGEEAG